MLEALDMVSLLEVLLALPDLRDRVVAMISSGLGIA